MQFKKPMRVFVALTILSILAVFLAACGEEEPAVASPTAVAEVVATEIAPPATWTPVPAVVVVTMTTAPTQPPPATSTPMPTATEPPATATPEETSTEESPTATATNQPRPTSVSATAAPAQPAALTQPPPPPTLPPNPTLGVNLLPNPSFEEGHYNQNGIPELQLPNGWRLEYAEGATGFGGQPWDVYVRPETRVLSTGFLPEAEHSLYIFDGSNTVKVFKGAGAVSGRLLTDVDLQPGTYVLEANFYSDVFESYSEGRKNPPPDPNAGEAALFAGSTGTGWIGNRYLAKNNLQHTFTIDTAQRVTVGVGFRGRYAIANNGWFVDNLSLRQIQ